MASQKMCLAPLLATIFFIGTPLLLSASGSCEKNNEEHDDVEEASLLEAGRRRKNNMCLWLSCDEAIGACAIDGSCCDKAKACGLASQASATPAAATTATTTQCVPCAQLQTAMAALTVAVSEIEQLKQAVAALSGGGSSNGSTGANVSQCHFGLTFKIRAKSTDIDIIHGQNGPLGGPKSTQLVQDELQLAGVAHVVGAIGVDNEIPTVLYTQLNFTDYNDMLQAERALEASLSRYVSEGGGSGTFQRGMIVRASAIPPLDKCLYFNCHGRNYLWHFNYTPSTNQACRINAIPVNLGMLPTVQTYEDPFSGNGAAGFTYASNSEEFFSAPGDSNPVAAFVDILNIHDPSCTWKATVESNPTCPNR